MKMPQDRHGVSPGFNLIELIACMAIGCIVLSFSYPMIGSLSQGNEMTHSLQTIAGTLEAARQGAIAKNTYVWVAFASPDPASQDPASVVVVVSSRTGLDPLKAASGAQSLAEHPDLEIGKPEKLRSIQFEDSSKIVLSDLPPLDSPPAALEAVTWSISVAGEPRTFDRALLFTPTGEASAAGFNRYIEFGVMPVNGNSANQAIIRTAALTGRSRIYRAE